MMEKHKIDEHFLKNLRNAEIEPSERAKMLFLNKIEAQKTKIVFWGMSTQKWMATGAAAAIVLILGIGFFKINTQSEKGEAQIAKVENHSNVKVVKNVLAENKADLTDKVSNVIEFPKSLQKLKGKTQTISKLKPKSTFVLNDTESIYLNPEVLPTKQVDFPVAKNEKMLEVPSNTANPVNLDEGVIVMLTPLENNVNLTGLSNEELDAIEATDSLENKRPLLNRVIGSILTAKTHKIINTKEVFSIKEDGFIASETRQIRDAYTWIKAKMNTN